MAQRSPARALAVTALAAAAALGGCAERPGYFEQQVERPVEQASEYLDERTGATVSIVGKPLVFARDRSERAANLRDYITLSAASINRNGKREYVLVAYVWSTLDARYAPVEAATNLALRADDRRIVLAARGRTPVQLGIGRPVHPPPGYTFDPLVYPADLGLLRFLAACRSLTAQVGDEGETYDYDLWDDQRRSLGEFVTFLEGLPQAQGARR